jgi:hypothetical protein
MNMPASEVELKLDTTQSKFNIDIRPEVFEMAFPPGTIVHDKASDKNYVINQGGEADYKAYAVVARKMAEELSIKKLTEKKGEQGRTRLVPLIVVNVLGISVVLLFVFWRRRAKA